MNSLLVGERLLQVEPTLQLSADVQVVIEAVEQGLSDGISCWRSFAVERREGSAIEGQGLFATQFIAERSLVAIKQGHVIDTITVKDNRDILRGSQQQIGPNQFLAGLTLEEVDNNLIGYNHSCEPNSRIVIIGGLSMAFLVTRQDVEQAEELTVDYAVSHESDTHVMFCRCATPTCRGFVDTRWDWSNPVLQEKYSDEFPPYIQARINDRNNQTIEERQGTELFEAALKSASGLLLSVSWLEAEMESIGEATNSGPKFLRAITRQIQTTNRQRELMKIYRIVDEMARAFVMLCPFQGDIKECGIDPKDPATIWSNLPKLVQIAAKIDRVFN